MGAWGAGPFDSDGGLDFLGDVSHEAGILDEEYNVISTITADMRESFRAGVQSMLSGALVRTFTHTYLDPATGIEVSSDYQSEMHQEMYAAAGLVAAALTPNLQPAGGTSLMERLETKVSGQDAVFPLDLSRGMDYITVLDRQQAQDLAPVAAAAVRLIAADEDWISSWVDRQEITDHLSQLLQILEG